MSKLNRTAVEKARKLIGKKEDLIEDSLKLELASRLARAASLEAEYHQLKDAVAEKRLDIEENARSLARVTRRAKRSAGSAEAAREDDEAAAKRITSAAFPKRPTARGESAKRDPAPLDTASRS
jgi:hypothetical protein